MFAHKVSEISGGLVKLRFGDKEEDIKRCILFDLDLANIIDVAAKDIFHSAWKWHQFMLSVNVID